MKMESLMEKKEDQELKIGDRIIYETDGRTGKIDRVFPNMPEGIIGIEFDDGKKEGVPVGDVKKAEEIPEEEKSEEVI